MEPQVAIIGAGPCGLMAAEHLAKAGLRVTVYDRMASPARKFLIAGRGGLNLTHSEPLQTFLTRYGEAADWLAPAIHAFPPDALRAWCASLGEPTFVGSSGRVFPQQMKAVQLLRAWLKRLESLGVQYAPRHSWQGWQQGALHFTNVHGQDVLVRPHATLLALGGASWPRLGSDGGWVLIMQAAGVQVASLRPANMGMQVEWSEHMRTRFAGTPLKPLAVTHAGVRRQGEAILTAQGIEGGVIYALSAALRRAIETSGSAEVLLDLRPDMSLSDMTKKLSRPRGNRSLGGFLRACGYSPLAISLLYECVPAAQLAHATPAELAQHFKALPLTLSGICGLERAISSAGGIMRSELNEQWMLRALPGTFAAGEMLDWEAPTGGYLLQACFSTAIAAAHSIQDYVHNQY
jgi:uncharacterized flavoprotein (TIGR03862 family)